MNVTALLEEADELIVADAENLLAQLDYCEGVTHDE